MIKKFLPLAILIAIWLFASGQAITKSGISLNTLEISHHSQDFITKPTSQLFQGQKIIGRFTAKDNNLGQLAVRFTSNYKQPSDHIIFRLKPENDDQWYYQAEYNTDQFQDNQLFPFGFPLIEQSKGQSYIFEIESLSGSTESGQIGISQENPPFTSRYTFSPKTAYQVSTVILKKSINITNNTNILINGFVYVAPVIYLLLATYSKNHILLILTPVIFITIDIIVFNFEHSAFFWVSLILVSMCCRHYRIRPDVISKFTFLLLIAIPISLLLFDESITEKLSYWFIVLLAVYSVQSIMYQLESGKKYSGLKQLAHKIYNSFLPVISLRLSHIKLSHLNIPVVIVTVKETKITHLAPVVLNVFKVASVLVSLRLIYLLVINTLNIINVYRNYYPSASLNHFIQQTGQYAAISLLVCFLVGLGLFFVVKNYQTIVFIVMPALLLSLFLTTNYIYVNTTRFQYDVRLWSVRPAKATLWDEIKLSGRNFRDMPFQGKVYIDNVEHTVVSWTDQQIVVQADPTKTSSGEIKVIDYYGKESVNTLPIEYYDFDTKEIIE